jgi:cytochrome P450
MKDVFLKATQWYAHVASGGNQLYLFRLQSFKHSLQVAISGLIWRLLLPDWALGFYKKGREIRESFKELRLYMEEMIQSRKEALEQGLEHSDLFSSLLRASAEGDESTLTDQELMGEL